MKKFDVNYYSRVHGIHLPQATGILEQTDYELAMDAQSPLVTAQNAGIPAFLTAYIDPKMIEALVVPMKAAEIFPEERKGSWTDQTAMFKMSELTGESTAYGDFNENGSAKPNYQYVNRQSYLFQVVTQWGALELERAGVAQLNYAADTNAASALVLGKFANKSYFYGISGLQNYGLLNDPSLSTPITPITKTAGGVLWSAATAAEVYEDIRLLYAKLITQTQGLIEMDDELVLAMSPAMEVNLTKTNTFNVNVIDQLKKNFPKLRVVTAVQYATTGGQLVQLIAPKLAGNETGSVAFNEKLRAHPVITQLSSWKQKKTSGTWGAIIKYPLAIAGLLGV